MKRQLQHWYLEKLNNARVGDTAYVQFNKDGTSYIHSDQVTKTKQLLKKEKKEIAFFYVSGFSNSSENGKVSKKVFEPMLCQFDLTAINMTLVLSWKTRAPRSKNI